jgi:signal transduction histidine kinase
VYADPGRITQVWVNLLSNACKYTPHGGRIKVWAERYAPGGSDGERWVVCAVKDTGIGIAAPDQDRVFEPFYRVRDPEASSETGTGLGLSISRSIVALHGGHMWLESRPKEGSTFFFTLPVA